MRQGTIAVSLGLAGVALVGAWALGRTMAEPTSDETESNRLLQKHARALEEENRALQRELRAIRSPAPSRDEAQRLARLPALEGAADDPDARDIDKRAHPLLAGPHRMFHPPAITPEQRRLLTLRNHGELIREMQLDERQTEALLGVLASHEERTQAAFVRMGPLASDPEEAAEMRATFEELREQRHEEMVATLGAQQAERFEALEKTVPVRIELKQIRDHLEAAGVPMRDEQRAKLLALMTESNDMEPPRPSEEESMDEALEKFRQWRSERARHLREHAGTVLTPAQLEQLDAYAAFNETMKALPGGAIAPGGG